LIVIAALRPQSAGAQGHFWLAYVDEDHPAGFEVGPGRWKAFYLIVSPIHNPPCATYPRVVVIFGEQHTQ